MNKLWIVFAALAVLVLVVRMKMTGGDAASAREKIRSGALVLDVRTAGEYQGGHYGGALNIPVQELEDRLNELGDRKRAIVVYCASGARSARAAGILSQAGFTNVVNAGGYADLMRSAPGK